MGWHKRTRRDYRRRLRTKVLDQYGGKCVRCGFSDPRALQVDHVNGDGHLEKRSKIGSHNYHKRILEGFGTGRYQLLCANCNIIKRVERGEHA